MFCLSLVLNMSFFWRKMNLFYLKYVFYVLEKKVKVVKKLKCIVFERNYIYVFSLISIWNLLRIFFNRLFILK